MPAVDLLYAFNLSPEDIVKYFESKGYRFSWHWYDTWQDAHAKAFTVAKAMKLELLQDIREEVERAIKEGISFKEFQKGLEPRLKAAGWWGKKFDPETKKPYWAGTPWRLRTIFNVNLRVAYMAGRGKALLALKDRRPYWQYLAVLDERTRPAHRALHGKIVPADDPFWDYYYPPNGWGCRCRVRALSERQLKKAGLRIKELEDGQIVQEACEGRVERPKISWTYKKVGERVVRVPVGIDAGWAYNPAKAAWQPDLDKYSYELAKQYLEGAITGPDFTRFFTGKVKGNFPVAVIKPSLRKAIKSETQVVFLSDETLKTHLVSHPEIGLSDYQKLPVIIDGADIITQEGDKYLIFIDIDGRIYHAVVKATRDRKELYLVSLRSSNKEDVKRILRRAKVVFKK